MPASRLAVVWMRDRSFAKFVGGILLCVVYVCAGKLGLGLAFENSSVSAVWPPAGLALAALLLWGVGLWPAIFVGAFIVNFTTSWHVGSALAIACGNTLEAVLAAVLTRRFACGSSCFVQVREIFQFVFFAAIPSTLLAAVIGVGSLVAAGLANPAMQLKLGLTWWTGDLVSDLVIAPLLVAWIHAPAPRLSWWRILELIGLLTLMGATSVLVFGPWNLFYGEVYPLSFLTVSPLLWTAYRFGDRGAVLAAVFLATGAIAATVAGHGPFLLPNPNDSLLVLQAFVGANALTALIVAALVSDRTRTWEILSENQRRLLMALESGRMGTWEWDISNGRVHWSASLEKLHGLAPGEFPGTYEASINDIHPDDRQQMKEQIGRTLEGQEHHAQYRLLLKDGTIRWVESRGRLVRDAWGHPVRLVGVTTDVTEQMLSQQERDRLLERERTARADAERANRSKDNFLAVLSHEMRTPLTPVLLTASLLESDPNVPESMRADVQMIRRNVEMEARLIDDLLDLTRITRGKLQLQFQSADLHEIIHRAIDISCRGASIQLEVELEAKRHHVRADPGRIQQVMWNLLNNARKFTPAGGVISVRSYNPDEKSIVVDVKDTGKGIDPEAIPKLFQAFEQGDSIEARRAGGLGLGLAISRALVTGHGGTLTAASEGLGKGATFSVRFSTIPEPAPVGQGNGEKKPDASDRRLRILLVEDNEGTLAALRRLLMSRKHHVVAARSIASARAAVAKESVDLVISDLGLPDGLGYDLMRDLGQKYGVRGIAISGYGMPSDIDQSRAAGFSEHLVKPVDAVTLDNAIARALAG